MAPTLIGEAHNYIDGNGSTVCVTLTNRIKAVVGTRLCLLLEEQHVGVAGVTQCSIKI